MKCQEQANQRDGKKISSCQKLREEGMGTGSLYGMMKMFWK